MTRYDPNQGAPDGCIVALGILGYALLGLLLVGAGIVIIGRLVFG